MIPEILPEIRREQNEAGQTRLVFESGTTATFHHPENFVRLLEPNTNTIPRLLLISGESESGKSTFGLRGLETGYANRIKIYKIVANLQEQGALPAIKLPKEKRKHGFIYDPLALSTMIENDSSLQSLAVSKITEELLVFHKKTNVNVDVVEAIKHPWIIDGLISRPNFRGISIFIEAPFNLRVEREAELLNRSISEVATKVTHKDAWNNSMGNQLVRQKADIIINNTGSKEDYLTLMDSLLIAASNVSNSKSREAIEIS